MDSESSQRRLSGLGYKAVFMNILILGKNGQVGWELQRALIPLGNVIALGREEANLEDIDQLRECILSYRPDILVNAAAYTAVDKAESEPDRARLINTDAVSVMAETVRELDGWMAHYSTDYVFDGRKSDPYHESDRTSPQSTYGLTKRDGEEAIRAAGPRHIIFRTSWVYGYHGYNFVRTMLRLARERERLDIVSDQIGAPTSAEMIADITSLCLCKLTSNHDLANRASGTYHLVPTGSTSWYEYAKHVISEAAMHGMDLSVTVDDVHPIPTSAYPTPAARPCNSRLDTNKLCEIFEISLPEWRYHVNRYIELLCGRGAI